MPQQFENPANLEVHLRTTAQEILADFRDSPIDVLITGVGTGGHITACAEVLKARMAGPAGVRGRADPVAGPLRRRARPAPDPGHRRRLHPRDHGRRACSTASSRSIRPTPRKWPAARPARKACWSASARARPSHAITPEARRDRPRQARPRLQLRHRRALSLGARLPARGVSSPIRIAILTPDPGGQGSAARAGRRFSRG